MDTKSSTRPPWVWAALSLQLVILSITMYTWVQVLRLWSRYAASGMSAQFVVREFLFGALAVVSLIGLWRTTRWGWGLALIADVSMCVQTLWFLLDYSTAAIRNPGFFAFNVWEFAALAVLLHPPVREHFLGRHPRMGSVPSKTLGILVYFSTAVISTCVFTAFSLAIFMGQKNGGIRGFALFLYLGLITGSLASFLFALILTLLARSLGPTRLWVWLLLGGSLAPTLILVLAVIGNYVARGPLNLVFWGPETLLQVWWLTPPTGVVTGWICYAMYPWYTSSFGR